MGRGLKQGREDKSEGEVSGAEEGKVVSAGWVSLSRSGKSLTIRVLGQAFFVPLGDLYRVLNKERQRAEVKQWVEQK